MGIWFWRFWLVCCASRFSVAVFSGGLSWAWREGVVSGSSGLVTRALARGGVLGLVASF